MDTIERLPPHSIEAEEAVLGSLLIDPDAIFEVSNFLRPPAFYRKQNQWIYEALLDLSDRREPVDLITLTEELRRRELLEEVGGEGYIIGLINAVPTSINAQSYGKLVEAASIRRRMIAAASTIANLAFDEAEAVDIVIDRAEQALFSISEERTTRDLTPIKQIARDYLDRIQELHERGDDVIGVPTGFVDLDRLLGGLNKSDLIIVAARPGMGKCVTADTRLVDPQSGALIDIETLVKRREARLLTLDKTYKLTSSQASDFVDDGFKPVYRVATRLGREIKTTLSHPFLTVNGWQPLHNLAVGDRIAVPRQLPIWGSDDAPEHEVKTLAYLLADGSLRGSSPQFTNSNPRLREDFSQAALQFPGNKTRIIDSNGKRTPTVYITQDRQYQSEDRHHFSQKLKMVMQQTHMKTATVAAGLGVTPGAVTQWRSGRNFPSPDNFQALRGLLGVSEAELLPNGHALASQVDNTLTQWLKGLGVWGKSAAEKDIPSLVYRLTRPKMALFLNRLFACDGSVYLQNKTQPIVSYTTASTKLAHSLQHLLLRFGIIAKLRHRQIKYKDVHRPVYQLRITDAQSILTFADEIGVFGKEAAVEQVRQRCLETSHNTNQDTIPVEVWELVKQAKGALGWAELHRKMGHPSSHNLHVGKQAVGRDRLLSIGRALDSEPLVNLAQSDVYWDEIVTIEPLGERQVYDLSVPGTHNFVADDMIVHNTSLQNALALTAANKHGKRVAMFNLEMSGEQLVQRMIAAETRIDSQRLRRGDLHEHEWPIFMEAVGRLSETRIFIDDTPSITPMQLRTKCRRLYAEHGLDMVMIDYLQLMQTERATQNRVQEISEISRALKGLARELDVPVLAAAQLSRAVEQRQDKRPLLSDLRDSGCLTGDTLVPLADTGERVPIRELAGKKNFHIWALNPDTYQLERTAVTNAFSTGIKQTYRLTTKLGRTIRATGNHKFLTTQGWKRLDELQASGHIALPRKLPTYNNAQTMSDAELALLGHMIGDGCTLPRHAIQYTTKEKDLAEIVRQLAIDLFGDDVKPRIKQERRWYQVYLTSTRHHTHGVRSAVSEWLDELGVWGLRSHEKRTPEKVFQQSNKAIALFLRHLWSTDGCIRMTWGKSPRPAIYYATSSKQLAQDVQSLLLRLSINARLKIVPQGDKGRSQYHVNVSGKSDIERFAQKIGTVGDYKTESLTEIADYISQRNGNTNRDIIPREIWAMYVKPAMQTMQMSHRQLHASMGIAYSGTEIFKQNVGRERAQRVADAVHSQPLQTLVQSDVYWDKIDSIELAGEEEVFDLTVPGPHNFVANDIIVHNSIEQDADIVMFIYRDEYYNPDTTERPNIAELNIAKHRNGPTGTVDLYWHGKLATFRNLQRQEINL